MAQKLIMHLDGDAFFVSVEMAKDPSLRGRAVVTGQERGIASALSYEAKKLGITRAMPVYQIRKQFPQVAVVSSDYESYAIFSRRMMDIVRRYTDRVEEYSIDECFADFSHIESFSHDMRGVLQNIKSDIKRELGISVSLGLGPTKVIAKTASKFEKPDGLTIVAPEDVPALLAKTPIQSVWGIGSATGFALRKKGITTALELAQRPRDWVEEFFSKPMVEMWHELNGVSVHPVSASTESQKSIMKTRTFVPATRDKSYVFSELSKNIEHAAKKARELGLVAGGFSLYLKSKDFSYSGSSCRLPIPTHSTFEIIAEAKKLFESVFDSDILYRATGVTLYSLAPAEASQESLFGVSKEASASEGAMAVVDRVNRKYGKSLIHIASSSRAIIREEKGELPGAPFLPKGSSRGLSVPYLGDAF